MPAQRRGLIVAFVELPVMLRLGEGRSITGGFGDVVLRCSACQATYRIDDDRVQTTRLKVRCPSCGHVFRVRSGLREPAYAGGAASGGTPLGGLDLVRDERRPPQAPAPREKPARSLPSRPLSPESTPKPEMPRWNRERTIDFDSGRPSANDTPALETAPFRPGETRDAAAAPPRASAPPRTPPSTRTAPPPAPAHNLGPAPQPSRQTPSRTPAPPARPPAPLSPREVAAPYRVQTEPAAPASAPRSLQPAPSQPASEAPWSENPIEPPPLGSLPMLKPPPKPATPLRATPKPAPSPALDAAHERAQRLARVLVSDIVVYNQAVRDRALREGNLASALGGEINKAWELYKSKVDAQLLHSTSYFKDALNEILASGQILF